MLERIKKIFKKEKKPETTKEPDFKDLEKPDIKIEEDDSEQTTLPPTPDEHEQW